LSALLLGIYQSMCNRKWANIHVQSMLGTGRTYFSWKRGPPGRRWREALAGCARDASRSSGRVDGRERWFEQACGVDLLKSGREGTRAGRSNGQTSAQVSGQYTSVENPPCRVTEAACVLVAATRATSIAAISPTRGGAQALECRDESRPS